MYLLAVCLKMFSMYTKTYLCAVDFAAGSLCSTVPIFGKFCPENTVCISTLKGLNNNIFKILLDVIIVIVYTMI